MSGIKTIRSRWLTKVALVLLALFTVALLHQVIPHDHGPRGHSAESCPLCVLFALVVLAGIPLAAVAPDGPLVFNLDLFFNPPVLECNFPPFSSRAPPRHFA